MFPILARKVLLEAIFGPVGAKTRRKVRIGAIFACKVLLEAIFGPVQKWRSRARARGWGRGWGWGLGLGLDGWFSLFACGFPLDVDTILVDSPDYELRSSLRHRIDLEDD